MKARELSAWLSVAVLVAILAAGYFVLMKEVSERVFAEEISLKAVTAAEKSNETARAWMKQHDLLETRIVTRLLADELQGGGSDTWREEFAEYYERGQVTLKEKRR